MRPWNHREVVDYLLALNDTGERWSSNDLVGVFDVPDNTHKPNAKNNQVGAAVREAIRRGNAECVTHIKSTRLTRKHGIVGVYRKRDHG